MRFLHTADWHVGKTIARRQRLDEAAAALRQMVEIAVDEKVDAAEAFNGIAPSPRSWVLDGPPTRKQTATTAPAVHEPHEASADTLPGMEAHEAAGGLRVGIAEHGLRPTRS